MSDDYDKLRLDQLPWIEKYKPKSISDLYMDSDMKEKLLVFTRDKNIPNLILTGISGIGKTSTIFALMRDLYGKYCNIAVLEINSFDGGIKTLNEDLVNFCKSKIAYKRDDEKDHAIHKTIIFEGADNIDERIQPQINTIMECYKKNTRFIFTCNTSANIIESIQSRCLMILYTRHKNELIKKKLLSIIKNEKMKSDDEAVSKLTELSNGDMRLAINSLQLVFNKNEKITLDGVNELCDLPQQIVIRELFTFLIKNNLIQSIKILNSLKLKGHSNSDILLSILHTLKSDICNDISDDIKICIYNCVALASYRISKGIDSTLQIISCLTDIAKMLKL
jgi:replication factor C subunit 2/4